MQLHFDALAPSLSLLNILRERASRDQDVEVFSRGGKDLWIVSG